MQLNRILLNKITMQSPLMLQPVWKTQGKKLLLAENCLDIFTWTDFAFTRLFVDLSKINSTPITITRPMRTVLWLCKMLYDYAKLGKFNHKHIIDELTYDTKNDKAFAVGGNITRKYMKSPQTLMPRIRKEEIKHTILGNGEKLLSPESRFDAAVISTPGLFLSDHLL